MDTNIDLREHRYAVLCEFRKAGTRLQYVMYPPEPLMTKLDLKNTVFGSNMAMMHRSLSETKNRAKWLWSIGTDQKITRELSAQIARHETAGWKIMDPVLVRIEDDDFRKVYTITDTARWSPRTPYKMLRAVDRILTPRGYRVTGAV